MNEALVLFSGGVDSTYIVTRTADSFERLLLVTYRVPGMVGVERSQRSAAQLARLYGAKIEHRIIDIRDFVLEHRGGIAECVRDNVRYRFFYSWCLGCKVSMHLFTMQYCAQQGLSVVMDGSNYYDTHALEQHKEVKDLLVDVYRRHGIEFVTPHYFEVGLDGQARPELEFLRLLSLHKDSTAYRNEHVRNLGISLGKGLLSQYRATQPSCITSVAFNAARLPLKAALGEEQGCCYMNYGYLNYITDKIHGREQSPAVRPTCAQGTREVYLDNASTTALAPEVAQAMARAQAEQVGNPSALHALGVAAAERVAQARAVIAARLGADPEEIVFTSGGTEANNLALKGIAARRDPQRDRILISAIEHPSIEETAQALSATHRIEVLPVDRYGRIDPAVVARAIDERTRLVSIVHGCHELGTLQPIDAIAAICRARGVLFHTDACQSFTKTAIDVHRAGLDLVSINAHKLHGPRGVGALYVRRGIELAPLLHGGGQEHGLRSGTLNTAGIVGFAEAVRLATPAAALAMASMRDHLIAAVRAEIDGVHLNGAERDRLCNHVSLSIDRVAGKTVLAQLNAEGFYISTRSACSSRVLAPSRTLLAIGLTESEALATIRIGISRDTTLADLDAFVQALSDIVRRERATTRQTPTAAIRSGKRAGAPTRAERASRPADLPKGRLASTESGTE